MSRGTFCAMSAKSKFVSSKFSSPASEPSDEKLNSADSAAEEEEPFEQVSEVVPEEKLGYFWKSFPKPDSPAKFTYSRPKSQNGLKKSPVPAKTSPVLEESTDAKSEENASPRKSSRPKSGCPNMLYRGPRAGEYCGKPTHWRNKCKYHYQQWVKIPGNAFV